jgi:hypothetical protein
MLNCGATFLYKVVALKLPTAEKIAIVDLCMQLQSNIS